MNRQIGIMVDDQGFAPDMPAFQLGAAHAGPNPLDDQVALQFSDHTNNDDHGAAQWAAGVELFPEADELDVEMIQFIQHLQEVADAAGQSIASPHQHNIELTAAGVGQQFIQTRAARFGAADPIFILLDDLSRPRCRARAWRS
jgi:hypothetical protein